MQEDKPWFVEWFDSPFYHILYGNRDTTEAQTFMNNLCAWLKPNPDSHFLDLGCGKGRHARALGELGYRVTGLDLSPGNIASARRFENDRLRFDQHDMRFVYEAGPFDYVLNLFTSFGFFDTEADLLLTLKSIHEELKSDGKLVIDYMNVRQIRRRLEHSVTELKVRGGIEFHIEKKLEQDFVIKTIRFNADRGAHSYTERVAAIDPDDFRRLLQQSGFQIQTIFGDYELNPYHEDLSDRLILIAEKLNC